MRQSYFICLALIFIASCTSNSEDQPVWETIFDGESLSGWTPKIHGEEFGQDRLQTFRASDGVLSVNYDQYTEFHGKFGHLFYERELSDYRLKFEYRFMGQQVPGGPNWAYMNSGAMLHSQDPKTMPKDQNFPVSVEAQLLAAFDQLPNRTTANVCTPGTHIVMAGDLITEHCVNSETQGSLVGQWMTFEADVRGRHSLRFYIDGALAFEMTDPQLDPDDVDAQVILESILDLSSGYISLQSESHPVEFQNIMLLDRANSLKTE